MSYLFLSDNNPKTKSLEMELYEQENMSTGTYLRIPGPSSPFL